MRGAALIPADVTIARVKVQLAPARLPPVGSGFAPPRVPQSCTSGTRKVAPFCFGGSPVNDPPTNALHHPEGQPGRASGVTKPEPTGGRVSPRSDPMSTHLFLYAVSNYKDESDREQSRWDRIGAMFPNTKGGYRIVLDLVPRDLNTDIVAMPPRERDAG